MAAARSRSRRRPHAASWGPAFPGCTTPGFPAATRPGAAVREGVAVRVGDGQAPAGRWLSGGRAGHVPGEGGVDGAEAAGFAGMVGQAEEAGQGNAQIDPGRQRTGLRGASPAGGTAGAALGGAAVAGLPSAADMPVLPDPPLEPGLGLLLSKVRCRWGWGPPGWRTRFLPGQDSGVLAEKDVQEARARNWSMVPGIPAAFRSRARACTIWLGGQRLIGRQAVAAQGGGAGVPRATAAPGLASGPARGAFAPPWGRP